MNEERKVASEIELKRERRRIFVSNIKWKIKLALSTAFWKILHTLKLASLYSKLTCRMGWYAKYPDGRCCWCGVKH